MEQVDVIIVGGGIAGLSLARQLKLEKSDLSVMVLEREKSPLPSAIHKVGESSVEVGAHYYSDVLGLKKYLDTEQYEKLGLRYFFKNENGKLEDRPEWGVDEFIYKKSYQMNRGTLENYLRKLVIEQGVNLIEGVEVEDIIISEGQALNTVVYVYNNELNKTCANWIVDASGRSRLIQNKFDYKKKFEKEHNSVWFRVEGRSNIDEIVDISNVKWHGRVKEPRWFSTNHMMGYGYWLWLIPLKGDFTSIGIVSSEELHPFKNYNTKNKALRWIKENEPQIAELIEGVEMLDFKGIKNYSHSSSKIFSEDGWMCVGEAGVFADPFYSVGNNLIAYANGITTSLICSGRSREELSADIQYYNAYFISLSENLTNNIQDGYSFMGNGHKFAIKAIWDYFIGWGISDPLFYHEVYLNPVKSKAISKLLSKSIIAQVKVIKLIKQWSERSLVTGDFGFIDYLKDLPTLATIFDMNLPPKKNNFDEVLIGIRYSIDRIEELANVIFFMAIEELYPEEFKKIDVKWIDITKISLDVDKWNEDGLFNYSTNPRDTQRIFNEISQALNIDKVLK